MPIGVGHGPAVESRVALGHADGQFLDGLDLVGPFLKEDGADRRGILGLGQVGAAGRRVARLRVIGAVGGGSGIGRLRGVAGLKF